jgi:hypothetical protein
MRSFWIVALFALGACSHQASSAAASAASPPPMLVDQRGTTMPLEQVVTHIAFRPYIPPQTLAFAVLPPLGDLDTNEHRGIGIEYLAGNDAMLLSQWPKQAFSIAFGKGETVLVPCTPTHYSTTSLAWTTPRGLVMTLQPDGAMQPAAVEREARRLIKAGACR